MFGPVMIKNSLSSTSLNKNINKTQQQKRKYLTVSLKTKSHIDTGNNKNTVEGKTLANLLFFILLSSVMSFAMNATSS